MTEAIWLLLMLLLISAGTSPLAFFMCCCDSCDYECYECVDGEAPDEFTVTIAGIIQGTGGQACCPSINGTYVLTKISDCIWRYTFPSTVCFYIRIDLELFRLGAGQHSVLVTIFRTGGTQYYRWAKVLIDDCALLDCTNFDSESLPTKTQNAPTVCDYSASTCVVTSG